MKTILKKPTEKTSEKTFDFTNAAGNYVDLFPQIHPSVLEQLFKNKRKGSLQLTEKEFNEFIKLVSYLSPFKDSFYNFYVTLYTYLEYNPIKLPSIFSLSMSLYNFKFLAEVKGETIRTMSRSYCLGDLKNYDLKIDKKSFDTTFITYNSQLNVFYTHNNSNNDLNKCLNRDLIVTNLKKLVDLIYEPFYLKVFKLDELKKTYQITFSFTNKQDNYTLKGSYLLMLFSFFRSLLIISSGLFELWVKDLLNVLESKEYKKLSVKNKRLFIFYALNYKLLSNLNTYNFQSALYQSINTQPATILSQNFTTNSLTAKSKFLDLIRNNKIQKSKLVGYVKIDKLEFPFKTYKEMISMNSDQSITSYWNNYNDKMPEIKLNMEGYDLGYKHYLDVLMDHLN